MTRLFLTVRYDVIKLNLISTFLSIVRVIYCKREEVRL